MTILSVTERLLDRREICVNASCDDQILKCCSEVLENGSSIHNCLDDSSLCLNLSFGFRVPFDLQELRRLADVPTRLGDGAFGGSIESIVIPRHVKRIGKRCFSECKSLCSVSFESDSELECLGCDAFRESSIESIVIPRHVKTIGKLCFRECYSLCNVSFE